MKRNVVSEPNLAAKDEPNPSPPPKKIKVDSEEVEEKPKPSAPPSGRQIIEQFIKGDVASSVTYRRICNALETFEKWEKEESKIQILEQFLNITDALDLQTEKLVINILKLRWSTIPKSIIEKFRNFLFELAVRQICFTEIVINSVLERFSPEYQIDETTGESKMVLDEKEQNEHYQMAHYIISNILRCFPMSSKILLKCVKHNFPHFTQSSLRTGGYIRNCIVMQKYVPIGISKDIWQAVFYRIVKDDSYNWSKNEQNDDDTNIPALFAMDYDILIDDVELEAKNLEPNQKAKEMLTYLDMACTDVITYINYIHKIPKDEGKIVDDSFLLASKFSNEVHVSPNNLFNIFNECLEDVMLTATNVHHVSFIWLYFCSLDQAYESKILEFLWQIVCKMPLVPADSKKSQGAAAYLAAFLARAKYVDKSTAFTWLEEMFEWLRRYVDQFGSGSSQIQPGLQRHGTFYAIAQSFFLVFAFRYRDFVKNNEMMESIRRWGVGRVVHSALEPLRFVSKPVARCFSAITRSLQLVYCNHVIPIEEIARPFEDMFPFDSYNLKVSRVFVVDLMRKFSPLAEDVSSLSAALCWNAAKSQFDEKIADDGGLDFLDEDELGVGMRDRSGTCGQDSLINYSATPGLKTFGNA